MIRKMDGRSFLISTKKGIDSLDIYRDLVFTLISLFVKKP
jgi:hypothetical protein